MPKTLITGGAGFIGLHLAKSLHEQGHTVALLDNFARGKEDSEYNEFCGRDRVEALVGDLLDEPFRESLPDDFDFIVHLAAVVGVKNVMEQPYRVLSDNVALTLAAIDLARRQSNLRKFVFTSTSEVVAETLECYGIDVPTPESTPLVIADPARPRTSYLLSKIYGEALLFHSGLRFVSFRPHNVYGPRMGMAHVIPELLKKAYFADEGSEMAIASPEHTRTFCYVSDAVEIISRAMQDDAVTGVTINLGKQTPEIPIRDLARIVAAAAGSKVQPVDGEDHPGSPSRRGPDMSKTTSLIGFESEVGLEEGVKKTFAWYKENVFDAGLNS